MIASPFLAWKAATDARYRHCLDERFGILPPGVADVWFHGASVGEVNLIKPIAKRLGATFRVTALTRAGREQAAKFGPLASYFPIDLTPFVRRAHRIAKPRAIVLVELEVWPNFLAEAEAPVIVVNGRMTERSFRRYSTLDGFFRRAFGKIARVGAQDEASADRFRALGVRDVRVTGNLKYDSGLAYDAAVERDWRARLGWTGPVIVAGSTHDPEERLLLEAYAELRRSVPDLRLAIVPRHLERVAEVEKLVETAGGRCYKRSRFEGPVDGIFVLDTVGELAGLYSIATAVYIGGTFCARGGQNMLEPAALGKPVVGGPSLSNFLEISRALVEAGGMTVVPEPAGLAQALRAALASPDMGAKALAVAERGRGALDRTVELIRGGFHGA